MADWCEHRPMLAELLEELSPQLLRRLEARPEAAGFLHQLIAALRDGRLDALASEAKTVIGLDVKATLDTIRLLKTSVYEIVDGRSPPTNELWLAAEWFSMVTERALGEEKRRLVAMLDAMPDLLILQDAELRFLFRNRAAQSVATTLTGLPADQVRSLSAGEHHLPAAFNQYLRSVAERANRGETVREEYLLPGPDGARWQEHLLAPVLSASGKVEAVAVVSRDIHAHKVAEARLQLLSKVGTLAESTEYEGVLSGVARLSIPELADWCVIDVVEDGRVRRGKVAHRDPAKVALAEEILRFAPEQSDLAIGGDFMAGGLFLVDELDETGIRERDPKFYDLIQRLGATTIMIVPFIVLGTPIALATFVFSPESGRRHGPEDLELAQEMARRAAQIIENARLQERLRQSEARFRVALERSNIAVFEMDTELRIRWMYNAQLGLNARDQIDKTAKDFFPVEISPELEEMKRRVFATGQGARTAVDAVINGERRHLLINYEPLRAVGGIVGITGAAVDITETKRAQEELAQELAFRERMMGILGHDLRNPLSSVLALSDLLQRLNGVSDKTKEGLQRIHQSAERMEEMIGTILEFTRLRFRGPPPLSIETVELDAITRTIVDELRIAHPGRAIDVKAEDDLRGRWDPGRIGQVISNLVGNALTHGARESAVQIALSADDGTVAFAVTNRGKTIPPSFLDRLFEPFWQAPVDGDARPRGLGLGLYIVRQLVLAHGGRIDVSSRDDVTTFTVRLPRRL